MKVQTKALRLLLAAAVIAMVAVWWIMRTPDASAHGEYEVGDHVLVFGWQVEPAYAGVYNGPELTITHHESEEPVEGAEETLKLKVQFGSQSKELDLRAAWGEPGRYVAQLTPTRPGDYKFVLTGTLEGEPVNLTFVQSQIDALKKEITALKAAKN
jgi:hypothetical protein